MANDLEKNGLFWTLGYKMGNTLMAGSLNEAKAKWARLETDEQEKAKQMFYKGAEEGRTAKAQAN
jgi:hypothetical protein